jgi:hypothetical protein
MNSWRIGFIKWRTREGPIGSHQELAREEKWETSDAETEEVEVEWERRVEGQRRRDIVRKAGLTGVMAILVRWKSSNPGLLIIEWWVDW